MLENDQALINPSYNGHLQVVEFLVNRGADIHAQNDQALMYGAYRGHLPVVKFLVSRGVNLHVQNDQALRYTSEYGYLPVVEFLISHGANINVLSPEQRQRYQHLVPETISVPEYYQLESDLIQILSLPNRYIFFTRSKRYLLMK